MTDRCLRRWRFRVDGERLLGWSSGRVHEPAHVPSEAQVAGYRQGSRASVGQGPRGVLHRWRCGARGPGGRASPVFLLERLEGGSSLRRSRWPAPSSAPVTGATIMASPVGRAHKRCPAWRRPGRRGSAGARVNIRSVAPGFTGNAPGGPSRWSSKRSTEWQALRPALVCEVQYDRFSRDPFRPVTKFFRWRRDKPPRECTLEQVTPTGARDALRALGLGA